MSYEKTIIYRNVNHVICFYFGFSCVSGRNAIESLNARIEALEERVTQLESKLEVQKTNDVSSDTTSSESSVLNPGVSIVGEDISAGKYNFSVTKSFGTIYTYDSYDKYKENQYSFNEMYPLASQEYLDSFANDEDKAKRKEG